MSKKEKVSQIITRELIKMIEEGKLPRGAKLPTEMELANQFNVSRAPIREALSVLRAMGIISSQQGGGSYVEDIGFASLMQHFHIDDTDVDNMGYLFELRKILEPEAAALAALRRTPEELEEIRNALEWLKSDFYTEHKTGQDADFEFHLSIVRATHNPVMMNMLESLSSLYKRALSITLKQNVGLKRKRDIVYKEHENIYLAIEAEQPELAKVQSKIHLTNVEKKLQLHLKS
ncbi:GntR family transcriptional repressor for pyruvate dehydrogenase complex [Sporosarcina luteola]|nr:GntR family transcriptional repressor for pyruvate dehydrogenase complex [Sporosarcina luteola]